MDSTRSNMSELDRQIILTIVRSIPKGKVTMYSDVSLRAFGTREHAELVGQVMRDCPDREIPVHRVVFRNGELGPYYSRGGPEAWARDLGADGVTFLAQGRVDIGKCYWDPNWESTTIAKWRYPSWAE